MSKAVVVKYDDNIIIIIIPLCVWEHVGLEMRLAQTSSLRGRGAATFQLRLKRLLRA